MVMLKAFPLAIHNSCLDREKVSFVVKWLLRCASLHVKHFFIIIAYCDFCCCFNFNCTNFLQEWHLSSDKLNKFNLVWGNMSITIWVLHSENDEHEKEKLTLGPNHPSNRSFRLNWRVFHISFHFLIKLAR